MVKRNRARHRPLNPLDYILGQPPVANLDPRIANTAGGAGVLDDNSHIRLPPRWGIGTAPPARGNWSRWIAPGGCFNIRGPAGAAPG